jgi:hypothetical protein
MRSAEMDPVLPELERMLTRAAARQVRRTAPGRRVGGWRVSRLVAVGAGCLVFAGTAMAATGVWNPVVGSESHPATLSDTPVPADLTAKLGVLRREQTPQDRSAEVEATLAGLGGGTSGPEGVRLESVRYLAPAPNGEATILLSGERAGWAANAVIHSESRTLLVGPGEPESTAEPLCVARPFPGDHQSVALCFGLSQLLSGEAIGTGIDASSETGTAFGVVPDGVASVTAEFESGPPVTVQVADNYWELPLNGTELAGVRGEHNVPVVRANSQAGIEHTVWRDADGAVIPQQPAR